MRHTSYRGIRATECPAAIHVAHHFFIIGFATGMLGCADLTKVSEPDVVQPPALNSPAGSLELRAGAVGQFANAFGGVVIATGVLTDELSAVGGSGSQFAQEDMRNVPDGLSINATPSTFPYAELQSARINGLRAIAALQVYNPTMRSQIAELFALVAYAELIMAEDMCDGVPLSSVTNDVPVTGEPVTRLTLLSHARTLFDSARAYTVSGDSVSELVAVGSGRLLLALDSVSAAAAVVYSVPTGYRYPVQYSPTIGPGNPLAYDIYESQSVAVSDREGKNGLAFVSSNDPRVVADSSLGAPVMLASGVEARLIEAEEALAAGDANTWLSDLNTLRADSMETQVIGLTPIADPVVAASRVDTLFTERAFWLFGTGHRQADLRRFVRQYARPIESVFPTGPYQYGGYYGTAVDFPVTGERASGAECISRGP
jgi:hypothetical protein